MGRLFQWQITVPALKSVRVAGEGLVWMRGTADLPESWGRLSVGEMGVRACYADKV